jgi:hypothetical protein
MFARDERVFGNGQGKGRSGSCVTRPLDRSVFSALLFFLQWGGQCGHDIHYTHEMMRLGAGKLRRPRLLR